MMACVHGEINSRADFHRVLGEATDVVRGFLAQSPNDDVMLRIQTETEAMKDWTTGGCEPTQDERSSIDIGLVAVRELDGAPGVGQDFLEKLHIMNSYIEDWPTDEEAASATDDDFFNAE
jgi:hypothetical protein